MFVLEIEYKKEYNIKNKLEQILKYNIKNKIIRTYYTECLYKK